MTGTQTCKFHPCQNQSDIGRKANTRQSEIMITILAENYNTISQEIYDKIVGSLEIKQLSCTCGHSGCLERHASYSRSLRILGEKITFQILRVRCRECGRTHAILLSVMVPYSQIPYADQKSVVANYENGGTSNEVLNRNCLIEEREISYIICRYKRHWKERLASIGVNTTDENLLSRCFEVFGRGFMQIKKTPNILFALPT